MKKWLIFVLGVITGILQTFIFAFCVNISKNSGIKGLEKFEEPGDYMNYSNFEVFQVLSSGCALAHADGLLGPIVFIIPNENQHFYDDQMIILKNGQCAQRVGTYKYATELNVEKTVPAIEIIDGVVVSAEAELSTEPKSISDKTLFDKPGDCVSHKNFKVQSVLESGDAIAKEISYTSSGYVFTSDLEVLMLAQDGKTFYDNQIVKVPQGKCARQIGTYKYQVYGDTKVIPIVEIR